MEQIKHAWCTQLMWFVRISATQTKNKSLGKNTAALPEILFHPG